MAPETEHLHKIDWQFFGTLTFTRADMSKVRRMKMVFALLRKIAQPARVHFYNLLWVLRLEEGEITQRKHFHLLIGGLPTRLVTVRSCFVIMNTWEGLGGGIARVRIFDPRLAGVDYVTKALGWEAGKSLEGANQYELAKFDSEKVLQLTLSQSVMNALRMRTRATGRRCQRDMSRSGR